MTNFFLNYLKKARIKILSDGLKDVIIYLQTEDKMKNRGFCFLEYVDHKAASQVGTLSPLFE